MLIIIINAGTAETNDSLINTWYDVIRLERHFKKAMDLIEE